MNPASRERLASQIELAATSLPRVWPLDRFVAWNPLGALEELPVEAATLRAAARHGHGVPGDEMAHRRRARAGRVRDADLLDVIVRLHPDLVAQPPIDIAGAAVAPAELIRLDVVLGPVADDPRSVLLAVEHCDRVDSAAGRSLAGLLDDVAGDWAARRLGLHGWRPAGDADDLAAFLATAPLDPRLRRTARGGEAILADLPTEPIALVERCLVLLHVDPAARARYLERHLARQPGWAAQLAQSALERGGDPIAAVTDHLAARLALEVALMNTGDRRRLLRHARSDAAPTSWPTAAARAAAVLDAATLGGADVAPAVRRRVEALLDRIGPEDRLRIWEEAAAEVARREVLGSLPAVAAPAPTDRPDLAVACCIDPRSERLRRHLEALGGASVETLGYAGFFGLVVQIEEWGSEATPSCPVLLDPSTVVRETSDSRNEGERARRVLGRRRAMAASWRAARYGPASAVAVPEVSGLPAGIAAMATICAPGAVGRWRERRLGRTRPGSTSFAVASEHVAGSGWAAAERVEVARSVLVGMGMVDRFAPLVVLCGHVSHHRNNTHRAAMACGACGGRAGGSNARIAAALLNRPDVRAGLAAGGIDVPDDTWFVAAEHDTTTDTITLLDIARVAPGAAAAIERARVLFARAGAATAAERASDLPVALGSRREADRRTARRAHDWSEVVPEWGLAGNRAMVIGPRALTAAVDLEGRAFLHSYRAELDPDGAVLAGILGGPLVVAHNISAQYLASAGAPEAWSAGPKALLNPVGDVGVRRGGEGDLRLGLPAESMGLPGDLRHDPARLVAVIDAPTGLVDRALAAAPGAERLVAGGWVHLCARPEGGAGWLARRRDGRWVPAGATVTASGATVIGVS